MPPAVTTYQERVDPLQATQPPAGGNLDRECSGSGCYLGVPDAKGRGCHLTEIQPRVQASIPEIGLLAAPDKALAKIAFSYPRPSALPVLPLDHARGLSSTELGRIRRILDHLARRGAEGRAPPSSPSVQTPAQDDPFRPIAAPPDRG